MRFEASQATMSVICWSVSGCAASERQSGIPSSGRPAMVMLRRSLVADQREIGWIDNGAELARTVCFAIAWLSFSPSRRGIERRRWRMPAARARHLPGSVAR